MVNIKNCPKCEGEFEEGFIGVKVDGNEQREEWGTGISFLKTGLNHAFPVKTFRCKNCGYMESFAI